MRHRSLLAGLLAVGLLAGTAVPAPAEEGRVRHPMVFDDQGYHPNMLRPGTAEYDHALRRLERAARPKPPPSEARLTQALRDCAQIAPLSQATREKCEIRARQSAAP